MVTAEEQSQTLAEEIEVLESIYIDELESKCYHTIVVTYIRNHRRSFAHSRHTGGV